MPHLYTMATLRPASRRSLGADGETSGGSAAIQLRIDTDRGNTVAMEKAGRAIIAPIGSKLVGSRGRQARYYKRDRWSCQ